MNRLRKGSATALVVASLAAAALVAVPALGGTDGTNTANRPQTSPVLGAGARAPTPNEASSGIAVAKDLGNAFAEIASQARPAVVSIQVETKPQHPTASFPDLRRFGLPFDMPVPSTPRVGQGSGFVVSKDGLILTNFHVVKDATHVTVRFADGSEVDAKVLGTDPTTDIALIQVPRKDLSYLRFADSDRTRVGDWVVAIGSPFGLTQSVSAGIVSAKGRNEVGINDLEDFIQTDAAINPGNSGGPLLDLQGRVIGMNSAILSRSGGNVGIGFAVPSNLVQQIETHLAKEGHVTRGFLGVGIQDLTSDLAAAMGMDTLHGALVSSVEPDSPAAKAGVEPGDVVLEVDGHAVLGSGALRNAIGLRAPGSEVKLTVLRGKQQQELDATLGERPGGQQAAEGANEHAEALGLQVQDLTPDIQKELGVDASKGAVVTAVEPGSAAARAGLAEGMVIVSADRQDVQGADDLAKRIDQAKTSSNDRILLRVITDHGARWIVLHMS